MSDRKEIIDEKIEEIKEAENWQCGKYAAVDPEEYEKQCLLDLLVDYISEDNNYVVNNAIITCDHMTDKQVNIEYKKKTIKLSIGKDNIEIKNDSGYTDAWIHFYEAHIGEEGIGRLYAVHAAEQTDNGIPFATVIDCRCQREIDEGQSEGVASILSLGNCGILKESDIENIGSRNEKARKYGTCYCLMKLADEWINPFCIESVVGEHKKNDIFKTNTLGDVGALYTNKKPECKVVSHHKAMKWSTEQGQKEGLTLLSTLLCTRGGIISIVTSGQIKTDIEEEISSDDKDIIYVTLEQLQNGNYEWKFREIIGYDLNTSLPVYKDGKNCREITQDDVDEINRVLNKYEINTPNRISHFLAQCFKESGQNGVGVEQYDGDSPWTYFEKYEVGVRAKELGNTQKGDGAKYRGAGAMQMTGKLVYESFSTYMNDPQILEDGALYVAKEYYWESAGYFWSVYKPSTVNDHSCDLNQKCDANASVKEITQIIKGNDKGWEAREEVYDYYISVVK